MKKLQLRDLPVGLWTEMRYCLEEEISYFQQDSNGDLAHYPELTIEQIPLLQLMIAFDHRQEGSLRKIMKRYRDWLVDLLSNYYDDGQYGPDTDGELVVAGNEWVGKLEHLRDRL